MTPPTVVRPQSPDRSRRHVGLGLGAAALTVIAAVALTSLVDLSARPDTVARITYENPTPYALGVEVSSGPGDGWVFGGTVAPRSTAAAEEIVDQGEVWLFRFDSQGETGGELRLSRAELEASDWLVRVPPEVGRRLAEAGAPPSP